VTEARRLALDDPRWTAFVATCPDAQPFHHPAWADLLADVYGYRAFAIAVEDAAGEIAAGLPMIEVAGVGGRRRWIALPFTDSCAPLVRRRDLDLAGALDEARCRAGVTRLEVRADTAWPGAWQAAQASTHRLRLDPDPEVVFERFHRSQVQRGIRRAEHGGVVVRRGSSTEDVAGTFYDLHVQTRRRQGVPVQPRAYFRRLAAVLERGLGFALLAYAGATPVAGAVFLAWNGTVVYKYGASDPAYWRLRPNHLIFWHAIRWACESGYRILDFGRTDASNSGLRAFKQSWGAEEQPLVYVALGNRTSDGARHAGAGAIGALIRRSPAWVCRLAGELLYRHAA